MNGGLLDGWIGGSSEKTVLSRSTFKGLKDQKDFFWLYAFNFKSPHTVGKTCVFFIVETLSESGMSYSSHFFKDGVQGTIQYTGTFNKSDSESSTEEKKRQMPNILHAEIRNSVGKWPMDYQLIVSDAASCAIFRVLGEIENGNGCMVLVSNSAVRGGDIPEKCKNIYVKACDQHKDRFEKIFTDNCQRSLFQNIPQNKVYS
uniref:Lipocalin/cytosolic fatty-acid binding domain-containing protein n=1 Tax=Amblyomma maculatum TaxID=34609 RepID=G3MT03_AMBMU